MKKIAGQVVMVLTGVMLAVIGALMVFDGSIIGGLIVVAFGAVALMLGIPRKVQTFDLTEGEREIARKREAVGSHPKSLDDYRARWPADPQPMDAKLTAPSPLTDTGTFERAREHGEDDSYADKA